MNRSDRSYKPGLVLLLLVPLLSSVSAQNNTLYFMHPVPQVIHSNPALFYRCRTYIEVPALSSVQYAYNNSSLGYHDVFRSGSGASADSIIIDLENVKQKLHNRNYVRNDQSINVMGAGFQFLGDYYLHFNIAAMTETRTGYPGDLVNLTDGNWDLDNSVPREIDLGGLGASATTYLQFAAGISTELFSGLYVGATLKYLKGAANVSNKRSKLMLETEADPMQITATTDYSIRASLPVTVGTDASGIVTSLDFSNTFANPLKDYLLNKNHGGAIDLGVIYEYDDRLTLAASLVNAGLIRWGSNTNQFETQGTVTFEGFDLRAYAASLGDTDFLQALADSVAESFDFTTSEQTYWSFLTTRLYTGASYQLMPKVNVSGLVRTEFFDRRPHFSLTLAGMYSPLPFIHGTLSYSVMNYKFNQLGAGIAVGGKGAQFYFVTDNIPVYWVRGPGFLFPYSARTFNFRFGINVMWGCDERDRDRGRGRPGSRRRFDSHCPAYR